MAVKKVARSNGDLDEMVTVSVPHLARDTRLTAWCIVTTAKQLGIPLIVTPSGRRSVTLAAARRIIQHVQESRMVMA